VYEALPVVLNLLDYAVRLQDVDDANEEQEAFAAMVLGGDAAPHVAPAAGQVSLRREEERNSFEKAVRFDLS
jgi:hypothetical protein